VVTELDLDMLKEVEEKDLHIVLASIEA